ncbi:porin family protein [bacterium]|nr:porin family protein [bacterium]
MKIKATALILVLLFSSSVLSLGLGPQVGIYKSKDADESSTMFGLALRTKLLPTLGIEGSINYRQEKYMDGYVTVKSWPIQATGLIYVLPILYGAAGMGWYNVTIDYKDTPGMELKDETARRIGWHFGGGLELPLGPSMTLAGDVRYVFLDYKFKDVPGAGDQKNDFYVITVSLLFGL